MGNDSPSGLSPGYRRGTNPLSPSPFKRSFSSPDISWRSLGHRHKFLLCMLGLLTLLCTVYLYFAVTLGASDSCSGLGGSERLLCQLRTNTEKADSMKGHHRRLLYVEDEESSEETETANSDGSKKDFMAFLTSWAASIKDVEETEITRLKGTITNLQRTIASLQRSNTRLRKTVTILRKDQHKLPEEKRTPTKAIPVPPKAIPVTRKATRLRGDI